VAVAAPPNIIYVLADDLGYGDLGSFGQERIQTPSLDRLAAEGVRFTQHYAGSTVCAPSRCVLMTGLHTGHARVRGNNRRPLLPDDVTVAELLKGAGYRTALIGKWGLGEAGSTGVPNRQGFDYFYGYLNQRHAHNYYPEFLWRNDERVPQPGNRLAKPTSEGQGRSVERTTYSHDVITDEALAFVERAKDGPFFLYLAYTIPHANNEAGRKGMEVPSHAPYESESWPDPQKGHAAMITRLDRDMGRLLELLDRLDLADSTIVMFSSDNGPHREGGADPGFFESSGSLRGIKRALYEGGIRVPFIVRWPGVVAPGTTSDHVSAFQDVLPTLAEIGGVETPPGLDGISFLPTLRGEGEQPSHPYLYWEFHEQGGRQAVRLGEWKGVRHKVKQDPDGPIELYDLATDPSELRDVSTAHPAIVDRIARIMSEAHVEPLRK
jgi:arylsulfatase A-like enzyme